MKAIFFDFETHPIADHTAPKPTLLGIRWPGQKRGKYWAFGHPTKNNCTEREARSELKRAYDSELPLVGHNASGFDVRVAAQHWNLREPWDRLHDTQELSFMEWPLELRLGLKPLSESKLGIEPEARNALHDWIKKHVPEARRLRADKSFPVFYWKAPGNLVGKYCLADLQMTAALFDAVHQHVGSEPYERERRLWPVVESMERRGVPLDRSGLQRSYDACEHSLDRVEEWLLRRLGDIDLTKQAEVVDAMEKAGFVKEWIETNEGKPSLSYQNMRVLAAEEKFDEQVTEVWAYRTLLRYSMRTFMMPWLNMGGDHIYCRWNSVRSDRTASGVGAKTGRLSSSPNFQNIISFPPPLMTLAAARKRRLEGKPAIGLPRGLRDVVPLPELRRFIRAPKGQRLVGADFAQQEMRILAHFIGGDFRRAYLQDPSIDAHDTVKSLIQMHAALDLLRTDVKITGFRILYGSGIQGLAEQLEKPYDVAKVIRAAYKKSLRGLHDLEHSFRRKRVTGDPYYTIGGRRYEVEPGFEYKALNYIIQGSAADQMKETMIRFHERMPDTLILSVHDEPVTLQPRALVRETKETLVDCMVSTGADGSDPMLTVPMRADSYDLARWRKT